MAGERLDYSIERQRHEGFVGRAAMLTELDRLLVDGETDRWVVVTGGPGMGKSAILAAWLMRRESAGVVVPHHFIRRGQYGWDEPATIVRSLAAQVEELYPGQRDPEARPESRLVDLLARVSARQLAPNGGQLVILIDGLDEYDAPAGVHDPLAGFLPHALPRGVRLLCASRPRHPYLDALEARDGVVTRIDLDDPAAAEDNDATVRALWHREATALGLDGRFIDEAVVCADGNLQHAATLRKHLEGVPAARRRVEAIPRGLRSLLTMLWRRVANDAILVHGLGILCAAREPLSLDELSAVASWDGMAQRHVFVQAAREMLVETRRDNGTAEYRLHHDSIRGHIMEQLGQAAIQGHHAALAQKLARWPAPTDAAARRYALRHAIAHRIEAADWMAVGHVARDFEFLEAKCCELGVHDVEAEVSRAAERCRAEGNSALGQELGDISRALARESHWLHDEPHVLAGQLWNRLRRMGWSLEDLGQRVRLPVRSAGFLRVRHAVSRESPALVRELVGHMGRVNACALTPDGRRVISASDDATLKVWDLDTGRAVATLEGHIGTVRNCTVTPDGRGLISMSGDTTLKLWDLDTGRVATTFEGHTGSVWSCALTPDSRRLISASNDMTLKVWNLDTGRLIMTLEGHNRDVRSCAVTFDGQRVVSASGDTTLKVWDLETGRVITTFKGHTAGVNDCAMTLDGRRVVSASSDKTLKVWELYTGRVAATLEGHTAWVNSCMMTPDGRRVVSASEDKTLKIWNLDTGCVVMTLEGHTGWVNGCAVTPDGRRVISASDDGTLKVWDLEVGHDITMPEGHTGGVSSCALISDGRRVVSTSGDKTLKIWDLETGRVVATLVGNTEKVSSCTVTPNERLVITASSDKMLRVWDLDVGCIIMTLEGHTDWVNSCAMTPDGQRAVSASSDKTLKVWDLATGHVLVTLEGHIDWVNSCVVTPDGNRVVSASGDRMVKVWDLKTGYLITAFKGHTGKVSSCAVTPDGQRAVSASSDKTLKLWDLATGRIVTTLEGHTKTVTSCAVTPDGLHVISASLDMTLKLWDLTTYQCVATHRGDAAFFTVAATATTICAGDGAGTLWFLDWPFALKPQPVLEPTESLSPPKVATNRLRKHRSRTSRNLILFLAANPSDTSQLALDEECAAIERELGLTTHRDDFEFRSAWAVTVDDLARHLMELSPTIIHFSGHGVGSGRVPVRSPVIYRDVDISEPDDGSGGIYLHGDPGGSQLVTARALAMMIKSAAALARVVVLNACYSEAQADALCSAVDCVVGMTGAIRDDAARAFAVGFYRALGNRRSVGNAVEHAVATLAAKLLPDEHLPRCRTRDGVDADQIVLRPRA